MKKTLLALAVLMSLSACGRSNSDIAYQQPQYAPQAQPQYAPAPAAAPVIVQAAPAQSGVGDMLMGGAVGYMLGRHTGGGSNGGGSAGGTTVNKTVINKTVIVQNHAPVAAPAPVSAPAPAPRPTYAAAYATKPAAPAPRPSYAAARSTSFSAPSRSYGGRR